MAKKSSLARQKRREVLVQNKWEKRQQLKKTIASPDSTMEDKQAAMIALTKMPRDSSPSRLRNRCQLTGRPRGFLRKFGVSRLCFRELASFGYIPGLVKASW